MNGDEDTDFGRRYWHIGRGRICLRVSIRALLITAVTAAATAILGIWSLGVGSYTLAPGEILNVALGHEQGFPRIVVLEWRLPRVVAAVIFGAALGVSGAIFQSLTQNPLASPDVIGFASGAYTGAILMMITVSSSFVVVAQGALIGGIVTALLVYVLSYSRGVRGFRLIIVGIGVSAMLSSLNTWMLLRADLDVAMSAAAWGAGSLNAITWGQISVATVMIIICAVCLALMSRSLHQLEMGDDIARATGVRAEPSRLGFIVTGVGLTAAVTAAAGPISFIALAAPQIAQRLVRSPGIPVAASAAVGAALLLSADVVAQHLAPEPLPVGVVTVVVGGTYLIWLLIHETRKRA